MFNYLLEISFLPAMLIFQNRHLPRCVSWRVFPKLNYLMRDLLPFVIISGRFVWISSLSIVVAAAAYITYTDLQFPQYNPLQLFVDSNEHEWYDNNAEKKFEFVNAKLGIPIAIRLVWGLTPRHSQSIFRPEKLTAVRQDLRFSLKNTTEIEELALKLRSYRKLNFINHESLYWPERYVLFILNVHGSSLNDANANRTFKDKVLH